MPLTISHDPAPEVDVLNITTEYVAWEGVYPDAASDLVVKLREDSQREVVGLLIIGASGYLAPHFRVNVADFPVRIGDGEFTRYDPEADTLTWGVVHADAARITQADPVVVYWGFPDPEEDDDDSLIPVLGVALLNAAKHLSPHFVLVEPPAE